MICKPSSRPNTVLTSWMAAMGALLGAMIEPASAAPEVRGQVDQMQLRAENTPIAEVLEALAGPFKLTYKLAPGANGVVSGHYSGSLSQVLSRILDGNDFIINVSDD